MDEEEKLSNRLTPASRMIINALISLALGGGSSVVITQARADRQAELVAKIAVLESKVMRTEMDVSILERRMDGIPQ